MERSSGGGFFIGFLPAPGRILGDSDKGNNMLQEAAKYKCDLCGEEYQGEQVFLRGVTGTSGGILMPEWCHERHFCSVRCFWKWTEKYKVNTDKGL